MEFYNVKKREKVNIPDDQINKTTYGDETHRRYAAKALDDDGTKMTKFISKENFDKLDVPEV